jgi:hypothetical protein
MFTLISALLCAGVAVEAAAIGGTSQLKPRQTVTAAFVLPIVDTNITERVSALEIKRSGWQYGPSIAGNTAFFPTGTLGSAVALADRAALFSLCKPISNP